MEVQKGIAATLRFPEADGDPVSLSEPTVTVVRESDGATIVNKATTEGQEEDAFFTHTLKGVDIPEVDLLTVTWADANSSIEQQVEVVGGFACSLKSIRDKLDESTEDLDKRGIDDAKIEREREKATRDIEAACWDGFRHRFAKETLNGDNSDILILNHRRVVKILSISIEGTILGKSEIDDLSITSIGVQRNFPQWPGGSRRGYGGWIEGTNNIVITYVYGHENYLSAANPVRDLAADYLTKFPTNWEGRATSYTDTEGNNYRMVVAGEPGRYGGKGRRFNVPTVNAFVEANESIRLL